MSVLMCPVTAQYTGEVGVALVVCSAVMSIVWPATFVVWARSAQDILAGIAERLAMSAVSWFVSVGTFVASNYRCSSCAPSRCARTPAERGAV